MRTASSVAVPSLQPFRTFVATSTTTFETIMVQGPLLSTQLSFARSLSISETLLNPVSDPGIRTMSWFDSLFGFEPPAAPSLTSERFVDSWLPPCTTQAIATRTSPSSARCGPRSFPQSPPTPNLPQRTRVPCLR